MTHSLDATPSTIDRIRHDLVDLKMPRAGRGRSGRDVGWDSFEVVFVKIAARLRARGYDDAMRMSPGQLVFHSRLLDELDDADFTEAALATLLAQAAAQGAER
ncbi:MULTISPECIES: hypothetical protein [unclassified Aureimonas]|uniref:hypothetical protein n=1 Tax=unclassified Aureimonas TaxID=2615206 RepID=UPI0006FB5783|nr:MULTISPECIES: hypothetical protein [unclassified Aureimonas]KQT63318.1 hypothetical protein ASG62_22585 [Aureimonas sp. Leaf427]KQT80103.1 hypothetical protein ASG54_08180 [Aureimonas sp. Leaf460]